ncbi:MAG: hypothetical protein QNJ22_14980 [Desulfosarcinaceae bacterium]|nr:hypothetical protein [Desulfosarcinaceae bacterium]
MLMAGVAMLLGVGRFDLHMHIQVKLLISAYESHLQLQLVIFFQFLRKPVQADGQAQGF